LQGGTYVSFLKGGHLGAPLRFVRIFLTATRYDNIPGETKLG